MELFPRVRTKEEPFRYPVINYVQTQYGNTIVSTHTGSPAECPLGGSQSITEYFLDSDFSNPYRVMQHKPVRITKRRSINDKSYSAVSCTGWWLYQFYSVGLHNALPFEQLMNDNDYTPEVYPWLEDIALTKAYANLQSSDMDFGMFAAEYRELIKMFKNPLNGSVQLLRKMFSESKNRLRRPTLKHAGTALRTLGTAMSDQWLEYRYGINPLANDLASIAWTFVRKNRQLSNEVKVSKAYAVHRPDPVPKIRGPVGVTGFNLYFDTLTCAEHTATAKVYYRLRPYMENAYLLAQLGLSPTQIGSLIYELTPFSFVLDWFLNLGDWIKSISPTPWLDVESNIVSVKTVELYTSSLRSASCTGVALPCEIRGNTPFQFERETLVRKVQVPLPLSPSWRRNDILSLKQRLDGLALTFGPTMRSIDAALRRGKTRRRYNHTTMRNL